MLFTACGGGNEGRYVQLCPLVWGDARHGGIFEDTAVQELHDVECGSDHVLILTQAICFGDRDICLFQSMDDSVFAIYFVGGLGEQFARWLLAHDKFVAILVSELVCRIGLSVAELIVQVIIKAFTSSDVWWEHLPASPATAP
jgi:hypothetical protein